MRIGHYRGSIRWLAVAGALLAPAAMNAANAVVVADTYIDAASPAANFGSGASILVSPSQRGLLQFDLSSLPPALSFHAPRWSSSFPK